MILESQLIPRKTGTQTSLFGRGGARSSSSQRFFAVFPFSFVRASRHNKRPIAWFKGSAAPPHSEKSTAQSTFNLLFFKASLLASPVFKLPCSFSFTPTSAPLPRINLQRSTQGGISLTECGSGEPRWRRRRRHRAQKGKKKSELNTSAAAAFARLLAR